VLGGVLENLGSNLEKASADASVGFRAAAENLGTTLLECNRHMQIVSSEIGELGGVVRHSAEGFNSSANIFSEASERGQVILNGLTEAITLIQPTLQANERAIDGCNVIVEKTATIAESLHSTVERFGQSTSAALEQVDRSSMNLERLTEDYVRQSGEVSRTLATTASTAVASFDRTRSELASVFTILEGQMNGYKESLENYNHTVREGLSTIFKAFDQETENLVTSYSGICSTTRKTSMELAGYTEDMCKSNLSAMKEASDAIVKLSHSLSNITKQGAALEQLEGRIKEIFAGVKNIKQPSSVA
jgi:predicted  nucleic acid-binding Zn-ribbon protein